MMKSPGVPSPAGLWLLLALAITTALAHPDHIQFRHLTIENGLSQNAVFDMVQDSRGRIWIGTKDGLNKFDGYEFTVYESNPFDPRTLSYSAITALCEDGAGNLWIGTLSGGLNRMDLATERVTRLRHDPDDPATISEDFIGEICLDGDGNLWFGTHDSGLNMIPRASLDADTPMVIRYRHDPGDAGTIDSDAINAVYSDRDGVIWVGTREGLNRLADPRTGRFQRYAVRTHDPRAPLTRNTNAVTAITEDIHGGLWLGTGGGVARFDRTTGTYTFFPHQFAVYRYDWGSVGDMAVDEDNRLWLATPAGLMRFDPVEERFVLFEPDPLDPGSISHDFTTCLLRDRQGSLWIGTNGYGVNVLHRVANRFHTFRREDEGGRYRNRSFSVRSIFRDADGMVWIGAEVLYRWNRATNDVTSFETSRTRPDDFGNTGVWAMIQEADRTMWVASSRGLFRYHPDTGDHRLFRLPRQPGDGDAVSVVFDVYQTRDGTIWAVGEQSLFQLTDEQAGRFAVHTFNRRSETGEFFSPGMWEDQDGDLWFGTNDGLMIFHRNSGHFFRCENVPDDTTSISNNLIRSICPDPREPDRYLWVGTAGGGLNRYDRRARTFRHYTTADGLPNNVVYGILADDDGRLWLSTNNGLSCFDPRTGVCQNFDVNDGLQSNEFNTSAYFQAPDGEMFFGGIKGLNYFHPADIRPNPNPPDILITDLRIFNRSVAVGDSTAILSRVISETDTVTLSYRYSVISFEFAALDFAAPGRNRYAYLLEGFNRDWINLGRQRNMTVTNLDPGDYTLKVRAANSDGVWNREGVSLHLRITPPWWRTGWAYAAYAAVLILLLVAIRQYEVNRLRLKSRLEVERMNADSLRELERLRSRFFTNISHEFRTPLTLILGPIERLLPRQPDDGARHSLRMMQRNAVRLLKLINQLLDLSRLDAGRVPLHKRPGDLVRMVRGIAGSYTSLAEMQDIRLETTIAMTRLHMMVDADIIEKVLHNLLGNAFKFTGRGGVIRVGLDTIPAVDGPDGGSFVRLSVADSGPGIPPDRLEAIFDRFYQVEDGPATDVEGTGIGLALVRELTVLHGGRVMVDSEVGRGSTFVVTLPVTPADVPDVADAGVVVDSDGEECESQMAEAGDMEAGSAADPDETVILVVDDNADLRAYVRDILEPTWKVVVAATGVEGVNAATELIPDLVVSDVMMPDMDGYRLCETLKSDQRTSHIPVILLTARAERRDRLEGLGSGADVYLTKPFDSHELRLQAKNLIDLRRSLRERFSASMWGEAPAVHSVDQVFLTAAIHAVEAHLDDAGFSVGDLCTALAMSERQLRRKLKAVTGHSPNQFVRHLRLERARTLLEGNAGTVSDICYQVGFASVSYFSKCFREQFGVAPSELIAENRTT